MILTQGVNAGPLTGLDAARVRVGNAALEIVNDHGGHGVVGRGSADAGDERVCDARDGG